MAKPMKVLIAYDGSPSADEAIEDLQRAGLPNEVEAVVLSVADLWLPPNREASPPPSPRNVAKLTNEARTAAATMMEMAKLHATSASESLRQSFPTWHVQAKSVADSPAWAIVLEAERWRADLIVVGSQGHSSLGRWILGSVSQTVLTQATCSVRIARGGHTSPNRPLRILVGIDGSSEAEMAVRAVAERMWPAGTDILLLMVLNPSILSAISTSSLPVEQSPDDVAMDDDGRIEKILDHYLSLARENTSESSVSARLESGDPKQILLAEADIWGADCIFIGSRGLSRWERLLLGSVSTAVATRAQCSVEVVRATHHP